MKLWLQVLFAQGFLWRDRYPERFEQTKTRERQVKWSTFIPLVLVVPIIAGWGSWWSDLAVACAGIGWFLFLCYPLRLDQVIGGSPELWVSFGWIGGLIVAVGNLALLVLAVSFGDWNLLPLAALLWYCVVTSWLRAVEVHYLIFEDPAGNSWRLDAAQGQTKEPWLAHQGHILAYTYWHFPRQILFDVEAPRRATVDGA